MLSSYWLYAILVLAPFVLAAWMERDASQGDAAGEDVAHLVRRIQAGDPAAESDLVARFSRGLLLMLRRLVQNRPWPTISIRRRWLWSSGRSAGARCESPKSSPASSLFS